MKIEIVLTETDIIEEFAEAMEARDLPEKFFYWFPLSVKAWLELVRDPDFYAGLRQCWKGLLAKAPSIVQHFGASVPVISFGAGDGSKDHQLLESLRKFRRELKYFPVDSSQALLEMACAGAEDADIETAGIKADISSPVHLIFAADAAESPKLFLMTGNTLGAFYPIDQIQHVAQCLHEGDRLVIDGEIYDDHTLERRKNPALSKLAFAPLASVGVTPEDGEVRFDQKRDERHSGFHLITRYFHVDRDLHITTSGKEIFVERGERIAMNFQYVYTPEAFRRLLTERAHLKILQDFLSQDGRFITAVCSR